jgi:hypothetical protein
MKFGTLLTWLNNLKHQSNESTRGDEEGNPAEAGLAQGAGLRRKAIRSNRAIVRKGTMVPKQFKNLLEWVAHKNRVDDASRSKLLPLQFFGI